jgi:hypothetical protein
MRSGAGCACELSEVEEWWVDGVLAKREAASNEIRQYRKIM